MKNKWRIEVTKANVEQLRTVASSLRIHLADLLKEIQRYPLEVHFAGYRLVFDSECSIQEFVTWLDSEVSNFAA